MCTECYTIGELKMIDIFFKAKRIYTNEWIYGYYVESKNKAFIIDTNTMIFHEVWKRTVCQYIGECDGKGNKAFLHDKISYCGSIIEIDTFTPNEFWRESFIQVKWFPINLMEMMKHGNKCRICSLDRW